MCGQKPPAKDKRNEDAIAAEENVQSSTDSAVAEAIILQMFARQYCIIFTEIY